MGGEGVDGSRSWVTVMGHGDGRTAGRWGRLCGWVEGRGGDRAWGASGRVGGRVGPWDCDSETAGLRSREPQRAPPAARTPPRPPPPWAFAGSLARADAPRPHAVPLPAPPFTLLAEPIAGALAGARSG